MKARLHGISSYDFMNDKNERVAGKHLYIAFADPTGRVQGEMTQKVNLPNDFPLSPEMKPGCTLDIEYDFRGKPMQIQITK